MAERDSYRPGTFSWAELLTPDREAAKRFYAELFGWEAEDNPVGDAGVYTMFAIDGKYVAATYQPPPERGIPPNWGSYVTVESADDAAARVGELGGTVLAEPFDVMDAGRMAVFNDPQGAGFMVWEPKEHIGAHLVNGPGALTLNQLNTNDPEASARFYTDLFGWEIRSVGEGYWGIFNGGALNGGMMPLPPGFEGPPHWLVYFGTEDVDAATGRVAELGGEVVVPPLDVPGGRISVARDPQGAYFAVLSGRFDD